MTEEEFPVEILNFPSISRKLKSFAAQKGFLTRNIKILPEVLVKLG